MDTQNKGGQENIKTKSRSKKLLKVLGLTLGVIVLTLVILIISVAAYTKIKKQEVSNTSSTSTNTKTINGEKDSKYSDAFMENFKGVYIKGCIGDNPAKDAFCQCSYTNLIGKYGFEGFMQKTLEYQKTKVMEPEFLGAVANCVSLMPPKQR